MVWTILPCASEADLKIGLQRLFPQSLAAFRTDEAEEGSGFVAQKSTLDYYAWISIPGTLFPNPNGFPYTDNSYLFYVGMYHTPICCSISTSSQHDFFSKKQTLFFEDHLPFQCDCSCHRKCLILIPPLELHRKHRKSQHDRGLCPQLLLA